MTRRWRRLNLDLALAVLPAIAGGSAAIVVGVVQADAGHYRNGGICICTGAGVILLVVVCLMRILHGRS